VYHQVFPQPITLFQIPRLHRPHLHVLKLLFTYIHHKANTAQLFHLSNNNSHRKQKMDYVQSPCTIRP
jgi:hypothetical protein